MTKEKEEILKRIDAKLREVTRMQKEIPILWDQYYNLNKNERSDDNREA